MTKARIGVRRGTAWAWCALATVLAIGAAGNAAIIERRSVSSDQEVREGGTEPASMTGGEARIGFNPDFVTPGDPSSGPNNQGRRYVMLFLLPTLASGETIVGADLQVNLAGLAPAGDGDFNVDLVGLGTRTAAANTANNVTGADYAAAGTDLMEGLIPAVPGAGNAAPGFYSTDTGGDAALLAYLNTFYATPGFDPEATNTFLALRLEQSHTVPVTAAGAGIGYNVRTGDVANVANRPLLTLTTVIPEPASLAGLFAVGATFAFQRRRPRH